MTARQTVMPLVLLILSLPGLVHSFKPLFSSDSITHRYITRIAILRKTAEVCRDIAASNGLDFTLTIDNSLSAGKVQRACSSIGTFTSFVSTIKFEIAIATMYLSNAAVDQIFVLSAARHFDDETFHRGRDIITEGVSAVKASVKLENFYRGRWTLGQICHTLQDFYSHSNWVELGYKTPYSALIRPEQPLENLAGRNTPTCRSCAGENCINNILPDVLNRGLLTSGYFSIFFSAKPTGKCSHGGFFDRTSRKDSVGGINKDTLDSSHGIFHHEAADLAIHATMELLEDIRLAAGEKNFLRLMGLSQSPVLCFVIDTTGSMRNEIDEAKRVSLEIIDRKRGTGQEPSGYILVPFNDPDYGPLVMTANADVFIERINCLSASGGGDIPEMVLSGLQLALTAAPPFSEIFVFTDAPAKDGDLKNIIIALIESTKSQVTFMLTGSAAGRRRRRASQGMVPRSMSQSAVQLYQDLAEASGGQAIQVTKSELSLATSVIVDSSASAVVIVFQASRNPGRPDNFNFTVDGSLQNITAYITGDSALTFSLTSSTGVSQTSSQSSGPLASVTTAGNLRHLSLNTDQTGLWQLSVSSNNPYSVKVTGISSVNFIYNLVEESDGAHGDFSLKEGRPLSGGNTSILITVTARDTVKVTEVTLFDNSGPTEVEGSLQSLGSSDFLVTFSGIPAGEFVLILKGEDSSSTSRSTSSSFQRQASTRIKTSSISVTAQANNTNIEPGTTISIPFTVATTTDGVITDSATETFTVRVSNDRSYTSTSPSSVTTVAGSGGKANGTVTLTAPSSAASGTDVTLTIEAENAAATDINYVVLRFSVTAKVKDVNHPVCHIVSTSTTCASSTSLCASSQWEFIANFTDGINGTGIDRVTIRQGNGTLNITTANGAGGDNITVVTYTASCCSQIVELTAVDGVGNVGTCVQQARLLGTVTKPPPVTSSVVKTTSTGEYTLYISINLWISVVFSVPWK